MKKNAEPAYSVSGAEPVPQELEDRRAIVLVEHRDEQERHENPPGRRADEELEIMPVLRVRDGRDADHRQRADFRGDERQRRDEGRHASAAEEEIPRVLFLPPGQVGDQAQDGQRDADDQKIQRQVQRRCTRRR